MFIRLCIISIVLLLHSTTTTAQVVVNVFGGGTGQAGIKTLQQQREDALREVYSNLYFPKASQIIQSGGLDQNVSFHVFDMNVSGRINPLGNFDSLQDTVEYFYALGNPINGVLTPGQNFVYKVDIQILDIVGTRASVSANIWFLQYQTNNTSYMAHQGWYVFRPNTAKILHYDVTINRIGQAIDIPESQHAGFIALVCSKVTAGCVNENLQYDNFTDCVNFMSSITYGTWDNAWSDSVIFRPWYHCAHSGPTGGEKCVNHPYNVWLDYDYVFHPEPDTFEHHGHHGHHERHHHSHHSHAPTPVPTIESTPTTSAPTTTPAPTTATPTTVAKTTTAPTTATPTTAPGAQCGLSVTLVKVGTAWDSNNEHFQQYDIQLTNSERTAPSFLTQQQTNSVVTGSKTVTDVVFSLTGATISSQWNINNVAGNSWRPILWSGFTSGSTLTGSYGFIAQGTADVIVSVISATCP